MALLGFSHLAVGVRDLDEALVFYRDVLSFRVRLDTVEEFPARGVVPEMRRRAVYLEHVDYREAPHSCFLVLDQQLSREPFGETPQMGQLGTNHFGLWVDDVEAVVARARSLGFEAASPPHLTDTKYMGEDEGRSNNSAAFRDPDGNIVQVDQRVQAPAGV